MTVRDVKAQDAVKGAYGVSYAVAWDGEILAMSGGHCHGSGEAADAQSDLTFIDWDLFSIIQGDEVRTIYRAIHESVIKDGRTVEFEYRCDAPDLVRRMSMMISPFTTSEGTTAALYQSRMLEVKRRLPMPFLDRMRRANTADLPVVSECAWCARVNNGGAWRKAEQYFADGGAEEVKLTQSICPPCSDSVIAPLLGTSQISWAA